MDVREPANRKDTGWFCCFYGLTDAGKTHLLGTAIDCEYTSPVLFVDVDQGDLTLSGKGVDSVTVSELDELQEIYEFFLYDNEEYRALCFDGFTAQEDDVSMPAVMGEESLDLTEFHIPTLNNWGTSMFHVKKVLRAFKSLTRHPDPDKRIHVFATALEQVDERRDIGVPGLPGKLGLGMGAYLDVLGRLVVEEDDEGKEVRYLRATKHIDNNDGLTYLGKNRLRLLPRRMKNPTISRIMRYLVEEKE